MTSEKVKREKVSLFTFYFSTAGASVSLMPYCSPIYCLKLVPSQLIIELQALGMIGTSYKKRASGGSEE